MSGKQSNRRVPALITAGLIGTYGFFAGSGIGFGAGIDNLPNVALLFYSCLLLIVPTLVGLLVCRRFCASHTWLWLSLIGVPPLIGFVFGLKPSPASPSQLLAVATPIFVTGCLLSVLLKMWGKRASSN